MFGLLNIDKPPHVTSRDVVNRIQALVRPAKVGHAGTLDPLARGVLVLCVGKATRLISYVQDLPKHYRGEFLLGRTSDTEDLEGVVRELPDAPRPTAAEIAAVLPHFTGTIEQRPPAYSAKKVRGRRAYDLARRGRLVELAPARVRVDAIALADYGYPRMVLDITCGGGTYIRSLGRDIAEGLGTCAVMSALARTAIGSFCLSTAARLDDFRSRSCAEKHLLPAGRAVEHLPAVRLTAEEISLLGSGGFLAAAHWPEAGELAGLDEGGALVAVVERRGDAWKAKRFLVS